MRIAALDFGSNTFLCLIADITEQGQLNVIKDLVEIVRLGQGVAQSGRFSEESLARATTCLQRFSKEIQNLKPDLILGVATAAARSVSNSYELINICKEMNIPIEIISGDREAELTFAGALSSLNNKTTQTQSDTLNSQHLVIDIGGGSTEIILGTSKELKFKKSFNIGVVKLKEKYISEYPISNEVQDLIQNEIDNTFAEINSADFPKNIAITAVAGTPTSLAAAVIGNFNYEKIDGFIFTKSQLMNWKSNLSNLTPELIEKKYSIPKGRSDVLAVGVMILIGALVSLNAQQLQVSTRGLRFGLLFDIWNKNKHLIFQKG